MLRNLFLATVLAMVALPAQAECPRMKAHKEEVRKLLEGPVGLTGDTLEKVEGALHESFQKKMAAKKEKHEAFEALAKLVDAGGDDLKAYEAALKRYHDAKAAYRDVEKSSCDALGGLLNAKQKAVLKVHMMRSHHGEGGCGCKGEGHHGKGGCGGH